jgi:tRNA modification GTPase
MDLETTIVAVSSAQGDSPRALIRASGPTVFDSVKRIGIQYKARQCTTSTVQLPEGDLPVLVLAFPATSSFTGQDTIEIELPNNSVLLQSTLNELIKVTLGRRAEAGEFTARAFFNGKLSLSEAEGICATISAQNDGELRGATLLREGVLHSLAASLSDNIVRSLSLVEAGIDFTDEDDVVAISDDDLLESIHCALHSIRKIVEGKISMLTLQHLPRVVIAGLPNAGKSTLFNAILGHSRVVVSDVVGTTRDAIGEPARFGDKEAMLIDIAGLEHATDPFSDSIQATAQKTLSHADLILWCVAPGDDSPSLKSNTIIVHTKSDLQSHKNKQGVCALSGDSMHGVEQLKGEIEERLFSIPIPSEDAIALLPRHEAHLRDAMQSLQLAENNSSVRELAAASLRDALNSIGSISGNVTPDDVIGEVFSSFCIGK